MLTISMNSEYLIAMKPWVVVSMYTTQHSKILKLKIVKTRVLSSDDGKII